MVCYRLLAIVANILLCLTYNLTLSLAYVHRKSMVYIGLRIIFGFRHPLGALENISTANKEGVHQIPDPKSEDCLS